MPLKNEKQIPIDSRTVNIKIPAPPKVYLYRPSLLSSLSEKPANWWPLVEAIATNPYMNALLFTEILSFNRGINKQQGLEPDDINYLTNFSHLSSDTAWQSDATPKGDLFIQTFTMFVDY